MIDDLESFEISTRVRKRLGINIALLVAPILTLCGCWYVGMLSSLPVDPFVVILLSTLAFCVLVIFDVIRFSRSCRANVAQAPASAARCSVSVIEPLPSTPEDRAYYHDLHGFDLEAGWDPAKGQYLYEAWFPLDADPQLAAVNVTIGARVSQVPGRLPLNRIIFRNRDGHEGEVYCTHTVVSTGTAEDALRLAGDAILNDPPALDALNRLSNVGATIPLPPWGHFAALKSYVAGIAEVGILPLLRGAFNAERGGDVPLTLGFNTAMQVQVLAALHRVAPIATDSLVVDFFLQLLDEVSIDWLAPRFQILDRKFRIAQACFGHAEFLRAAIAQLPAQLVSSFLGPDSTAPWAAQYNPYFLDCVRLLIRSLPLSSTMPNEGYSFHWSTIEVAKFQHEYHFEERSGPVFLRRGRVHHYTLDVITIPEAAWGELINPKMARCASLKESVDVVLPLRSWTSSGEKTIHNPDHKQPLNFSFSREKLDCTSISTTIGVKILLWDGHVCEVMPVTSAVNQLRGFLRPDHPAGQETLGRIACIEILRTGMQVDYRGRILQGVGKMCGVLDFLDRPFADLLGSPLDAQDVALGLGNPRVSGCVTQAQRITIDVPD